jgi:hypothetical protein
MSGAGGGTVVKPADTSTITSLADGDPSSVGDRDELIKPPVFKDSLIYSERELNVKFVTFTSTRSVCPRQ